jgi:hypothetical protein
MARWLVDIIGKKLQHLGTVDADNEREALAQAIKRFDVRPALRSKIAVTKGEGLKRAPTRGQSAPAPNPHCKMRPH